MFLQRLVVVKVQMSGIVHSLEMCVAELDVFRHLIRQGSVVILCWTCAQNMF